jgi:hypothetical protein
MTKPGDVWVNFEDRIIQYDDGIMQRDVPESVDPVTASILNVKDYGAVADGVTNVAPAITDTIAALPSSGGAILIPSAPLSWHLDASVTITKDNVEIILEDGAWVERDPDVSPGEPFIFTGVGPTAWDDITTDPSAGDVEIVVTTPGNFSTGDWVVIRDDEPPALGGSSYHREINRVRSKSGSTLTLEYPLTDNYETIATVKPDVSTFTPIIGSKLTGPGKITNGDYTDPDAGNAGVRFDESVGSQVHGVEFEYCQQEGIRFWRSFCCDASHNYIHDANDFDGSGRGITPSMAQHVILSNNRILRMRHAIDITNFCRYVLAEGNIIRGTAATALVTHPNVKWGHFTGNTIDGVKGFATGTANWGTNEYGHAIALQKENHHMRIANNRIANVAYSGIQLQREDVSDVTIVDNEIDNCNTIGGTIVYAGIAIGQPAGTSAAVGESVIIKDNVIRNTPGRGIFLGGEKVTCTGNEIRNITASGGTAGIMVRPYMSGGTPEAIGEVLVKDNKIEEVVGDGIHIGYSSSALVKDSDFIGNKIRNVSLSGIYAVPDQVDDIAIERNTIRNPNTGVSAAHAGITVGVQGVSDVASDNLVIAENTVFCGTSTRGIMTCVAGAKVIRNKVYESASIGIYVPSGASGQNTLDMVLAGNVIVGGTFGLYIADSSGGAVTTPHVIDNIVVSVSNTGIRFNSQCTDGILIDNVPINCPTPVLDNGSTTLRPVSHYDLTNYRVGIGTVTPQSTLELVGKMTISGDFDHDGTGFGIFNTTPVAQSTGWSVSNESTDKSYNADSLTLHELADVVGTLVEYLKTLGVLGA